MKQKKNYFKQYTCSCKFCIKGEFSRCSSGVKVLDSVLSNPVLNSQQNESIVTLDEPSYTVAYRKVKMSEVSFSKSNDNTLGFRENELVVNMTQQEFSVINEELSEDSEFRSGKPYTGASIDKWHFALLVLSNKTKKMYHIDSLGEENEFFSLSAIQNFSKTVSENSVIMQILGVIILLHPNSRKPIVVHLF